MLDPTFPYCYSWVTLVECAFNTGFMCLYMMLI